MRDAFEILSTRVPPLVCLCCPTTQSEERLQEIASEVSIAQASAAAARAAAREAADATAATKRALSTERDESSRLREELQVSRARCAGKVGVSPRVVDLLHPPRYSSAVGLVLRGTVSCISGS